jgi:peptidoglycan hydrolase-like protein with peptidoglycan-binding domain
MKYFLIFSLVFGLLFTSAVSAHEDGTVHPHEGTVATSASGSPAFGVEGGMLQARPVIATSTPMCVKFSRSLGVGARGREVTDLQLMLIENGYLKSEATGYFGQMTKAAVVRFQKDGGVNPTGYFGELSRKHHEQRCGTILTPPIACTMEARMCPDGTMMPRDNMCGWHPEKCGVLASTTISGTVSQ